MRVLFLTFIFFLTGIVAKAQLLYQFDQSVPVSDESGSLISAWAGGINSAQYSTMELNGDGMDDLVIFDRTANKVYTFLADNGQYKFEPEFALQFPDGLKGWMLLRDFNCDGKKDIFTSHPFGIRVFINETTAEGVLSWKPYVTGKDNSGNDQYFIKTQGFTSQLNLKVNISDLPAIVDVDGDSDLDILTFKASGNSTVEFHKNLSIETNGDCNALIYERVTQKWGSFEECECGTFVFNEKDCSDGGGREEHQAGKALLLLDMDGDGDQDAVVSEEDCPALSFLENQGDANNALMTVAAHNFPDHDSSVSFYFPAGFYEDVDFDGVRDILVSPNQSSPASGSFNPQYSSWFYKNNGSEVTPDFQLVKKNFLQDQMIDLGANAAPAFGDYDNDGDVDMIVGSYLNPQEDRLRSTLRLYENNGSSTAPSFLLVDNDYLGTLLPRFMNIKPKLKDINGDNRIDLVFSARELLTYTTNIYYILNSGATSFDFNDRPERLFTDIETDENFEIFDIDTDGLFDILIGKSNGRIMYYRNTGDEETASFKLEDESFYGFDYSTSNVNLAITITDLDADGTLDMMVGNRQGYLTIYNNFAEYIDDPQEGITHFIKSVADDEPRRLVLGSNLYPAAVNLFNEDVPVIVTGTGEGGMHMLRNPEGMAGHVNKFTIDVFPNPVIKSKDQVLTISSKISGNATVISILGQRVTNNFFLSSSTPHKIAVDQWAPGLYMVMQSVGDGEIASQKFIVSD